MKTLKDAKKGEGTPIPLPDAKLTWIACLALGSAFWIIGLILWAQWEIEEEG